MPEIQFPEYNWIRKCFHWKFWKPIKCVGGNVYFNFYYVTYTVGEKITYQTVQQFHIKADMGLYKGFRYITW
jgi:hypothetical protein